MSEETSAAGVNGVSQGIPFDLPVPDEDESDPTILQALYADLDPNDPLLAGVQNVVQNPEPHDGLEQRLSDLEARGSFLDPVLQDWRLLAADDPRGQVIQTRVADALVKKVDHLISRTRGEVWSNRSDVVREALHHYVRNVLLALQTEDPTLLSMLAEAELAGRASFHSTRRRRLDQAIDQTRDYLTDLVNLDDHEEAFRFLQELALRMRQIRVASWRRHWLLALNALPILKVAARLLDTFGWDIPQEFYPAVGKSVPATSVSARIPAPGNPT